MQTTSIFKDAFRWGSLGSYGDERFDSPSFRLTGEGLPNASLSFSVSGGKVRNLVRGGRVVATLCESDSAQWLFAAGVLPPDLSMSRVGQAEAIFPELAGLLEEAGMAFSNVVRTWFYVDRICEWYGEFNAARSRYFDAHDVFKTFLPASTGIGSANADGAALCAGFIAMKPKKSSVRAETVESPLQEPAMAYKSSFSRAAEIVSEDGRTLYISGTASIKPHSHEVAYVGDVPKQISCTMNAVKAIVESRGMSWKDVTRAIVYLKDSSSIGPWRKWLADNGLKDDFAAVTVCDVCRDEWLFEIELDAACVSQAVS